MADVKKCDICGGLFDECNKDTGLNLQIFGKKMDDKCVRPTYPRTVFTIDCCPECTEQLITEMANMNEQGNGMSFLRSLYEEH